MLTLFIQDVVRRARYWRNGFYRGSGTRKKIVTDIIEACWNGTYFQPARTSPFFSLREFSLSLPSLLHLGYHDKVRLTLDWAISNYVKQGNIFEHMSSTGRQLYRFERTSIDSIPLLLHCLSVCLADAELKDDARRWRKHNKKFLEDQIKFFASWVDEQGIVKSDCHASGIKYCHKRASSCYANCMAAMLHQKADKLKLANPLAHFDYQAILLGHFYNGEFFEDDLVSHHVSGDANVFPFLIIEDPKIFGSCLQAIRRNNLDSPLPLKFSRKAQTFNLSPLVQLIYPNFQGNTCWSALGLVYLQMLKKFNQPIDESLHAYQTMLDKYKNTFEVLNGDGTPYVGPLVISKEGMLSSAIYLDLISTSR